MPAAIPDNLRRDIEGLHAGGVPIAQIAVRLGISRNTASRHLQRAREAASKPRTIDPLKLKSADLERFRSLATRLMRHSNCWKCKRVMYLWPKQRAGRCHYCAAPWRWERSAKSRKDGFIETTGTYEPAPGHAMWRTFRQ